MAKSETMPTFYTLQIVTNTIWWGYCFLGYSF